jgi:hypothetical protein
MPDRPATDRPGPERGPIRELESFTFGAPVDVLPAAEVRRRGDRVRRRRTVATLGGTALVVAVVVAVPFALAGNGGRDSREPGFATDRPTASADPDAAWLTSIPASFDLAAGLPARNEDGTPVTVEAGTGELVELCGQPVDTAAGRVDAVDVTYSAPEDVRNRSLALYGDDQAAGQALASLRSAVAACGTYAEGGTDQVTSAPSSPRLGDEAVAWSVRYRTEGRFDTGLMVFHAVRVGNALLVASSYGEGGGTAESRWRARHTAEDRAIPVVDEMNAFAEHPVVVSR